MSRKRRVKTASAALGRTDNPIGGMAVIPPGGARRGVDRSLRGMLDGLQNLVAGLGNERDKRFYTDYVLPPPMTRIGLESMFMSSWLAGRIVTTVADDMTREWVELSWDGHDEDQEDNKAIKAAEQRWDLCGKAHEALTWARLYGGCVIVPSFKGDEDMAKPLDLSKIRRGSLQCLHVLDRWRIAPTGEIEYDRSSPNFGLPKQYTIADAADSVPTVHWSRAIRFNGRKLPYFLWRQNAMWDASELAHVLDNIKDYDSSRAGAASMLWEKKVDVMKAKGLVDQLSTADGTAKVQARYQALALMKSINGMVLIDYDDEDWEQKVIAIEGVKDLLDKFILDVSGAADIPITRLFGQSPAGLTATGESDIRNYYDHIAAKQQTQLRRPLLTLYEIIIRDALGRFPKNFDLAFRPLWQVSATEKATIAKTNADRDIAYLKEGVITEGLIARQLKADNVYSTMEDEDVEAAEALALEPDPVPVVVAPGGGVPPAGGAPARSAPGQTGAATVPPAKADSPNTGAADARVGDMIKREANGWHVYSESGAKHLGGPYRTKEEALARLAQVEHFKGG